MDYQSIQVLEATVALQYLLAKKAINTGLTVEVSDNEIEIASACYVDVVRGNSSNLHQLVNIAMRHGYPGNTIRVFDSGINDLRDRVFDVETDVRSVKQVLQSISADDELNQIEQVAETRKLAGSFE